MEAAAAPQSGLRRTRHRFDRIGDTGSDGAHRSRRRLLSLVIIAGIIWKVIQGAWPAIKEFGIAFVWNSTWNPVTDVYGAR